MQSSLNVLNTLYCPNCGRSNPYDDVVCGKCRTRLDNPTNGETHRLAYESPQKQPKAIECNSPNCGVSVYFPSPLKEGTYHSPRSKEGKENIKKNKKKKGVFCWRCGQYVLKPPAKINRDNMYYVLVGMIVGLFITFITAYLAMY